MPNNLQNEGGSENWNHEGFQSFRKKKEKKGRKLEPQDWNKDFLTTLVGQSISRAQQTPLMLNVGKML